MIARGPAGAITWTQTRTLKPDQRVVKILSAQKFLKKIVEFNLFGSVRAGGGAAGVAADDAVFVRAPGCCSPGGSTIAAARRAGCPRHQAEAAARATACPIGQR